MKPLSKALLPNSNDSERIVDVAVRRHEHGQVVESFDEVAIEEPFEVRIGGRSVALIMRTPGHDRYLTAGFLLAEGIISSADDVVGWQPGLDRDGFPEANVLDLRLRPGLAVADRIGERNFAVTSSCGLCGKASIDSARIRANPVSSSVTIASQTLLGLDAKLRAAQRVFARTGGLHAAGLFDRAGNLVTLHEDVGRHNAVDKVFGQLLLERQLPANRYILMVSGRASFELIQKAAIAGVSIFAAVGAPSSLAVEMALASEMTLIGMLRPGRFVTYSRPDRLTDD